MRPKFKKPPESAWEGLEKSAQWRQMCRMRLHYLIKCGSIPRADSMMCTICGWRAAQEYHHHMGYSVKHRFDVIPVCKSCHSFQTKMGK
jgi:hypothetical protein